MLSPDYKAVGCQESTTTRARRYAYDYDTQRTRTSSSLLKKLSIPCSTSCHITNLGRTTRNSMPYGTSYARSMRLCCQRDTQGKASCPRVTDWAGRGFLERRQGELPVLQRRRDAHFPPALDSDSAVLLYGSERTFDRLS